jgi:two-component system OmpR family sensor kinase
MMKSIRKVLISGILLGILVATIFIGAISLWGVRDEVHEILDYEMEQIALFMLWNRDLRQHHTFSDFEESDRTVSDVQVWNKGELVYSTNSGQDTPLVSNMGFSTIKRDGKSLRVFLMEEDERMVQVSQSMDQRRFVILHVLIKILLPLLFLMLILAWWVPHVITRSLKPLEKLRSSIRDRKPSMLSPISEHAVPEEIIPLVQELNSLLYRLDMAINSQKQFLADAAHELRTPLTALDLQIQNARYVISDKDKDVFLTKLKKGIGRASAMVSQLLAISRMESGFLKNEVSNVDLNRVAGKVLSDISSIAEQSGMIVKYIPGKRVSLEGNEAGLEVMLSSLLDNAVKYSPPDTEIRVNIIGSGDRIILTIEDEGPGIPLEERKNVFQRFYRYQGQRAMGSGLGLSIVKEVVDFHHGEIFLSEGSNGRGLKVSVHFPRTRSDSPQGHRGKTPLCPMGGSVQERV